jgi:hypothetical protein
MGLSTDIDANQPGGAGGNGLGGQGNGGGDGSAGGDVLFDDATGDITVQSVVAL